MAKRTSLNPRRSCVESIAAVTTTTLLLILLFTPFLALPVASQGGVAPGSAGVTSPADVTAGAPGPAPISSEASGPSWSGCVDPEKGFQPVTIGKPTMICLVLSNNGDWSSETDYMRLNFSPIADVYSRFHVPESFEQLVGDPESDLTDIFPGNITVHAESQSALSFQKLYYDSEGTKIYPFLTAIITVNEGTVTGITWDNACVFCAANECKENTYGYNGELATPEEAQQPVGACPIPVNECIVSEQAECDLLLYVVWSGTDSNGRDFTSSANRFSAFPKQSWSDRLNLGLPDWMNNLNPFGGDSNGEVDN